MSPQRSSPRWIIWTLRLTWILSAVAIKLWAMAGAAGLVRGSGWGLLIPASGIACGLATYRLVKVDTADGALWATMNLLACFALALATVALMGLVIAFDNWGQT